MDGVQPVIKTHNIGLAEGGVRDLPAGTNNRGIGTTVDDGGAGLWAADILCILSGGGKEDRPGGSLVTVIPKVGLPSGVTVVLLHMIT